MKDFLLSHFYNKTKFNSLRIIKSSIEISIVMLGVFSMLSVFSFSVFLKLILSVGVGFGVNVQSVVVLSFVAVNVVPMVACEFLLAEIKERALILTHFSCLIKLPEESSISAEEL